jgi:glutamine transport system substrate-binding protein
MSFKKFSILALVLAMVASVMTACGSGDSYTVATDNNFVPFEFMNEDTGEMEGFDIDLIQAIAQEAGIDIEIEAMKFDGVVAGMQSGRYDIGIAGMTITEERKKTIDFSNPYYDAGLMIAVHSDNTDIQSEDDLAGKKVATRSGTTSEGYIKDNHPDAKLVTFPSIVEAYMDLQAGRVDAVLYDVPNVQYYVATDGKQQLKTVGDILQGEQYGIAFPQDSELVEPVNKALQTLIDNGTYDDIYEKWFGERKYGTQK